MAKRKKLVKSQRIVVMSADEATLAQNPRYNGYAVGYGAHGSKKYNRRKSNAEFKRTIRNDWSSFSLSQVFLSCDIMGVV